MKVVSNSTCDLCGAYVPEGEGWLCPGCRAALNDAEKAGISVDIAFVIHDKVKNNEKPLL